MSLEYIYNLFEDKTIEEKKPILYHCLSTIGCSPEFIETAYEYVNEKNPTGLLCLNSTDNLVELLPEYIVQLMTPGVPDFNPTLTNQVFSDRDKTIIRCTRDLYQKAYIEKRTDLWQYVTIIKVLTDRFSLNKADVFKCFEFGQTKYSDWDFLKCVRPLELVLAFFRHLYKSFYKSLLDDESRLPHVAHCYCNILMLIHILRKAK